MDEDTLKMIKRVCILLAAAVIFYYVASPYQNCIRDDMYPSYCAAKSAW